MRPFIDVTLPRHRQACREALAATNSTGSLLALAWTTWVAVHELRLASTRVRLLAQAAASSQRAQLCCELCMEAKRSLSDVALGSEAWRKKDWSEKKFFQCATVNQTQHFRLAKFLVWSTVNMGRMCTPGSSARSKRPTCEGTSEANYGGT